MSVDFKEFGRRMDKTLEHLEEDFGAVRAGRANAKVLDRITVQYYGSETPLNGVATISTPDARTLVIQPWDNKLLKDIQKAIQVSDLGINPQNDGKVIRLVFPQLTEERRKDLAKQVKKYAEDAKVAMRNIRRDGMDYVKKLKKNSEITEDDQKKAEKDLQDIADRLNEVESQDPDAKMYSRAVKMAQHGAPLAEIIDECEIKEAEAQLIYKMYAPKGRQ